VDTPPISLNTTFDYSSISQYKNLKDFALNFDGNSFIDVFVGKNATGKSNLFKALIKIFRHIVEFDREKAEPSFNYRLKYEIDGRGSLNYRIFIPGFCESHSWFSVGPVTADFMFDRVQELWMKRFPDINKLVINADNGSEVSRNTDNRLVQCVTEIGFGILLQGA
jgi:energy-coupling factor transporter ATP-binding protein EcfA2